MKMHGTEPISVVLVEDQEDFANTIRDLLNQEEGIQVLGIALSEEDFRTLVTREIPDLALIDLGLARPDSGLDLLSWLAREYPVVRPVILTASASEVLPCYQAGARGYVLKTHPGQIAETLRQVHAGKVIIPPEVSEILMGQVMRQGILLRQTLELQPLSDREKEILALLHRGKSREQVAEVLGISFYTVRRHLQNVLEKTGEGSVKAVLEKCGEVLRRP